jgi:type IV secretion system protein VirB11
MLTRKAHRWTGRSGAASRDCHGCSAPGPAFALRKRAVGVIGLADYVSDGILSSEQAEFLRRAVRERQNILIAGGTSTG